ncbi:archaeal/vacuolar-type H+-ATPase subunit C [Candidatus Nitrososphaera evergladensis SR1]|uniref:Archaeal/vacuolar-type H+-ATPase subunit C n=1 Tax=Candidatus Nitrososphaera evergladensis SR1 TaxID=1459636 RepID=A0A075MUF9_9ARCH|nr:V-type ATPase subunit [Candidatus Nitrososphaera evergladensis]AIF85301.1 archaeal/vacuolar-type H+-ATPase subunit C [Candidatus Nitrososphaera evergladensis SR1]
MANKVSIPSKIFGTVLAHSMRGKMLSRTELQTLAESRDIEELVTRMKNTIYLDALAKLTKPYTAEKVEGALREHLVNTHAKMVTLSSGAGVLNAYFVKYITWNLKIILKGKALGRTYEELLPKINLRAEELVGRRDLVVKALVAKDFDEAVASLQGSEFGEDARKAAVVYKEKGDVRAFDTFLDHAFYKSLDKSMFGESPLQDVQKLVTVDIDAYNVLAVLRAKYWGLSAQETSDLVAITTTKISRDTLQKMINVEKIQEAIGELSNTAYRDLIPKSAENDIDAIMQLEEGFERVSVRRIMASYRTVFTLGNMLATLKLMMLEIRNLAAIAAGVEQKIPADRIMANLAKTTVQ